MFPFSFWSYFFFRGNCKNKCLRLPFFLVKSRALLDDVLDVCILNLVHGAGFDALKVTSRKTDFENMFPEVYIDKSSTFALPQQPSYISELVPYILSMGIQTLPFPACTCQRRRYQRPRHSARRTSREP